MKNLWSKEDLANFENSEVFVELEKRVLANILRADILSKKISNANLEGMAEGAAKATEAVKDLGDEIGKVKNLMNSAEDGSAEEESDEDHAEDALEDEIVSDLRSMAKLAVEKGDFKLAYKIERTIDEILETEVPCE